MYEYECLGCGKKFYSSVEYGRMREENKFCDECHDVIFYTPEELAAYKNDKKWLEREYGALEKLIQKIRKDK